jgi:hypothetical protein
MGHERFAARSVRRQWEVGDVSRSTREGHLAIPNGCIGAGLLMAEEDEVVDGASGPDLSDIRDPKGGESDGLMDGGVPRRST